MCSMPHAFMQQWVGVWLVWLARYNVNGKDVLMAKGSAVILEDHTGGCSLLSVFFILRRGS